MAAVVAGTLGFAFCRLALFAWGYALLIGMWRLWAGKHWPSDVLGSLVLGFLISWLAWRLSSYVEAWVCKRLAAKRSKHPVPKV